MMMWALKLTRSTIVATSRASVNTDPAPESCTGSVFICVPVVERILGGETGCPSRSRRTEWNAPMKVVLWDLDR